MGNGTYFAGNNKPLTVDFHDSYLPDNVNDGGLKVALYAPVPATPGTLAATAMSTSEIDLNWVNPSGGGTTGIATSVELDRSVNNADPTFYKSLSAGTASFKDLALPEATTYKYQVL